MMETDVASNHILVLCRSQFYWFDVLDANSDVIVTERDLEANFRAIIEDARSTPVREAAKKAIGVLSTENRRIWAGLREHLLKYDQGQEVPPNRESLQIVDSALFVLCLDDSEPVGTTEVAANVLSGSYRLEDGVQTGTCTNRWYDKLQIIVCKNGAAGINFERTFTFSTQTNSAQTPALTATPSYDSLPIYSPTQSSVSQGASTLPPQHFGPQTPPILPNETPNPLGMSTRPPTKSNGSSLLNSPREFVSEKPGSRT